jgi:signal transduction protein with GAF and PtsI domain
MDPVETLTKPDILSHLPTFLIIASVLITSLVIVIKKLADAYQAGKDFVAHAVDEKVPHTVGVVIEAKAPAIFDKVVAQRLEKHEEVEEQKLTNALNAVRNDMEASNMKRDGRLKDGFEEIMNKLTGVDSRLQVVQIRLESHEARLHAVEQVVAPRREIFKPKRKIKKG